MADPLKIQAKDLLTKVAEEEKLKLTQKNVYSQNEFEYNSENKNALSDNDDKGRGLNNNQIGTSIDNEQFRRLTSLNMFNKDNPYE